MEAPLTVEYEKAGDILYFRKTKPYPEQDRRTGLWSGRPT